MYASIHVPDFSVEAIARHQPELRRQPIAAVDGKPPVEIVVGLNAPARNAGIEPGMTRLQVEQFFATAIIRQRSRSQEAAAHAALLDCASNFSPRVEDTAGDTVVFDASGLESLFGSMEEMADSLANAVSQLGLESCIGIAANPDAAIYAARGWTGITIISPGMEAERFQELRIEILAADASTLDTFRRWGIHTLGALAKLPSKALVERLGQRGLLLHKMARGAAERPLAPRQESLQFEESMDLDDAITTVEPLAFILHRLCDSLFMRLRSRGLAAQEIDLYLEREKPHEQAVIVLRLPLPAQNPRVVMKLLMLDLDAKPVGAGVIGVRIAAIPARPRIIQSGLFVPLAPEPEKLELTLARIADVVGRTNVGSPRLANTHARDRFLMQHFENTGTGIPKSHVALRRFRPARVATVRTQSKVPAWVGFEGTHGEIDVASGPWRGGGEWWGPGKWNIEEWDVAIRTSTTQFSSPAEKGNGEKPCSPLLVRIYRNVFDNRWYVEGIYD